MQGTDFDLEKMCDQIMRTLDTKTPKESDITDREGLGRCGTRQGPIHADKPIPGRANQRKTALTCRLNVIQSKPHRERYRETTG